MTEKHRKAPEIGSRLHAMRKTRGWSLETLADASKVSRSMLSQIERGQTNPTFATLWALTQALEIEISQLIGEAAAPEDQVIEIVDAHNVPRIRSADGHCTLYILSPPEATGRSEWYRLLIEPGATLNSKPHAAGSREHLSVLSGEALVIAAEVQARGGAGDTLRYRADVAHSISNASTGLLEAFLVVLTDA
ncbi:MULTISPECIES: helix-turn-helix domain-containing protein [Asticcacaulis]|uniref:helix-turn-helix domain-containing protein n=1 Tax=Asticcacaulis TaxID=76890 RepID=UPI001AE46BC6|nr:MULTISPECIES: XRE family transcriptional regulator [Asticcacaulis]MBP2160444.1 transcriptional regulator with XRE-family HTH domain [Asticcacaulis solisilvae]MDR6801489.1 transcriptional regulator with XRE-family HTH domain [Asticcacaulis sp. BE141]